LQRFEGTVHAPSTSLYSVVSCSNFFQNGLQPATRLHGGTSHRRPIFIHCRASFRSIVLENVRINFITFFYLEELERCERYVLNRSRVFYSSGHLQSNFLFTPINIHRMLLQTRGCLHGKWSLHVVDTFIKVSLQIFVKLQNIKFYANPFAKLDFEFCFLRSRVLGTFLWKDCQGRF